MTIEFTKENQDSTNLLLYLAYQNALDFRKEINDLSKTTTTRTNLLLSFLCVLFAYFFWKIIFSNTFGYEQTLYSAFSIGYFWIIKYKLIDSILMKGKKHADNFQPFDFEIDITTQDLNKLNIKEINKLQERVSNNLEFEDKRKKLFQSTLILCFKLPAIISAIYFLLCLIHINFFK